MRGRRPVQVWVRDLPQPEPLVRWRPSRLDLAPAHHVGLTAEAQMALAPGLAPKPLPVHCVPPRSWTRAQPSSELMRSVRLTTCPVMPCLVLCCVTPTCRRCCSSARQFYGTPSTYTSVDDSGRCHLVAQGEGGEQEDPLMPAVYALAQQLALREGPPA